MSPANVGRCLELGPPFEMMMIMHSVLSLMESESSLGTNKQGSLVGAGNAKYPHLPLSRISSKDVTMFLSFTSNPPTPLHGHKHTPGVGCTHTHTLSLSSVLTRFTEPTSQPPRPNFKVARLQHTWLLLPERLSLGSRVIGSRGLKLMLPIWFCSALFSLLSSHCTPYKKGGITAPAEEFLKKSVVPVPFLCLSPNIGNALRFTTP